VSSRLQAASTSGSERGNFLGMKPTDKTAPRSVFNSLTMRLRKLTDEGNPIALLTYVNSAPFRDGLRMIAPEHLAPVLKLYAQARTKCDGKLPLIKRGDGSRHKWTPERFAKFRRALAQTGVAQANARPHRRNWHVGMADAQWAPELLRRVGQRQKPLVAF
jgi:hypothetical protein